MSRANHKWVLQVHQMEGDNITYESKLFRSQKAMREWAHAHGLTTCYVSRDDDVHYYQSVKDSE